MEFEIVRRNGKAVAIPPSDGPAIADVDSALDLLMAAKYDAGADRVALSKDRITEEFFELKNGLAGEILQKYVNYGGKIALYGDFSDLGGKALKDFMRESNKGKDVFFVVSKEEAIRMLTSGADADA